MQINNLVVAHYLDGRVIKGITRDFSPNRPGVHIEVDGSSEIVELRMRQLKALFFVKSFDGVPTRPDIKGFVAGPAETSQGRKLAVRFRDGEFLCGYTLSWSPDRDGFFLFPADIDSNNQRIFVVTSSTDEVKAGPQAETLAERVIADGTATGGGTAASRVSGLHARPSAIMSRPSGVYPASGTGGNSTIGPRPSSLRPRPSLD